MRQLTVNGDTIEAHELWRDLRDELATQARMLSPEAYRAYLAQQAARLIGDKITETLLYQQASLRLPPEMTARVDKYVDGEIRKIVTSDYGGIQRRYERYLESQGQTLEDVRERLRREVIVTTYLETEVRPKVVEPGRAELLAAFEASADSFRRPARRRMSLIDVRWGGTAKGSLAVESGKNAQPDKSDGATLPREQSEAARAEALLRVQTARAELASGTAFAEVARRYSDGLHAADGGAWGWVSRGSVRERFEPAVEALYRLNAGEVSDIIETRDGFFLVRCDENDPGVEPDFQTLQPRLKDELFRTAYNRRITELVSELRSKAQIEPANLEQFHAAVVEAALDPKLERRE